MIRSAMSGGNGEEDQSSSETDARPTFGGLPMVFQHMTLRAMLDEGEYSMMRQRRGKCIIFNYKCFDPHTNCNERTGTDLDADVLKRCFKDLRFEPDLYTDLSVKDTEKKLKELGEGDYSDDDCFVCCFLTHGDRDVLYARDGKIRVDSIMEPFRDEVCPSLVGKPKLFFIQACRGDKCDSGKLITCDASDAPSHVCHNLVHADFLAAYSTVPGYYSWRSVNAGSWFVQRLCSVLWEHMHSCDLLSMLTMVCHRVATECESCVPNDPSMHGKKQVPFITSTLTRRVNFRQ